MKTYEVSVKSRCNAKSEDFTVEASSFEVAKKRAKKEARARDWNELNCNLSISTQDLFDEGRYPKNNVISLW